MKQPETHRFASLRLFFAELDWRALIVGAMLGMIILSLLSQAAPGLGPFVQNLIPEFAGMVFTVLVLDNLSRAREEKALVDQLIRRMHSRYNLTALSAIEELRVIGKLQDGTVCGKELRGSNWTDANLYEADLRGCDLTNAELLHADLVLANLEGAKLSEAQLASVDNLCGAIMPDGSRYDGRYCLAGDFSWAQRKSVDLRAPQPMAEFYGVSVEAYATGQSWWAHNQQHFTHRSTHYDPTHFSNQPLPID